MSVEMTAEEAVKASLLAVRSYELSDEVDLDFDWFLLRLNDRGYTVTKMTKEEFALHVYSTTGERA